MAPSYPGQFAKGLPIRIIGGANKGYEGWLLDGKTHPNAEFSYVLLLDDKGEIFATWAKKKNLGPIRPINTTYWEAVLAGCPDIELKMNELAYGLAECQLQDFKPAAEYLEEKYNESVEILDAKGGKAKVRRIKYDPPGSSAQEVAARASAPVAAPAPAAARPSRDPASSPAASTKRRAENEPARVAVGAMDEEETDMFGI